MDFGPMLSDAEKKIFHQISIISKKENVTVYAVGGFVRDKILGKNSNDIDFTCVGDGIKIAQHFQQTFYPKAKLSIFKNFQTAHLEIDNLEIEFVGARKESYHQNSRNPIVSIGTFEDDQIRRDFTINALAIDVNNIEKIIDSFNGLEDLKNKIIRTPKHPDSTFFDDPLRILRAIRFSTQLNFIIEENTLISIEKNAYRLNIISKERIAEEINKILCSQKPSSGFLLLDKCHILKHLLPELVNLKGVEYIDGIKHKDNFYHSLQVVDNIAPTTDNLWLRWAALLHDIGKYNAKKFDKNIGWTFHGHEIISARMVSKIFSRLNLPLNEKMEYVKKIIFLHHRPISLTNEEITDSAIRRLLFDAGEVIDDLMLLCKADITSKNQHKIERYIQNFNTVIEKMNIVEEKDKLRNWQPAMTGDMIMNYFNIKPSKSVGIIKTAIREAILDGKIQNTLEDSQQFMITLVQQNESLLADKK